MKKKKLYEFQFNCHHEYEREKETNVIVQVS